MKVLNVAVVGAGIYGINHVNAYTWNPNTNLVAVCDLNEEIRNKIHKEYGVNTYASVEEMIASEELDAISIATPDAYHLEPALVAIENKIPVLIEKPLATKSEDAVKIIEAARENDVRVAVDYHKRWDPAAINLKNELVDAGRIVRGYINMDDIIEVPTKWFNWGNNSSPVHFLGTHCYDQVRWLTEKEVVEVYAVGTKEILKDQGIDTYDSVSAILTMEDGSHWVVENSWIYPNGFAKNNDGRTQITAEHKVLRSDSQNRGVEIYDSEKLRTPNSYFILNVGSRPRGFGIDPINDFIHALITGEDFIADANDGLQAQRIAEAVHESLELGKAVKIEH